MDPHPLEYYRYERDTTRHFSILQYSWGSWGVPEYPEYIYASRFKEGRRGGGRFETHYPHTFYHTDKNIHTQSGRARRVDAETRVNEKSQNILAKTPCR